MVQQDHYSVPPLERLDLDDILGLIREKKYFVLHAPRQTGKTSALLALQDLLNSGTEGPFRCVYANVEGGQVSRDDVHEGMRSILSELATSARSALQDEFVRQIWRDCLDEAGPLGALGLVLHEWAHADPRPLVLLIDEIDALTGDTLLSVLRQLRTGYPRRPNGFPQSIVLCGVRDVRDYHIHSGSGNETISGGSAFNIKAESLRLGDFARSEVAALLTQHTEETGQAFRPEALERVWSQTRGQPWLVNALCYQACLENRQGRDRRRAIGEGDILEAQEQLILERTVHLDHLAEKLKEDRVRRVIEPLLSGAERRHYTARDLEYVRDLGLVAADAPVRMANPIYAEVVPRELTSSTQDDLVQDTAWYVDAAGGLELIKLLAAFQDFYRLHSEHWLGRYSFKEAGPQLLLQAFLQRIVNGGGRRIEREYGLGRRRTDLLIVWPQPERVSRFVIECKVLHDSLERTIRDGIAQTSDYMDRCGADEGHLVVFDRGKRRWADKIFRRSEEVGGVSIGVWGM